MINPCHDELSEDYPDLSVKGMDTRCIHQCSTRAAQNIYGHHRPVIAFLSLVKHQQSL